MTSFFLPCLWLALVDIPTLHCVWDVEQRQQPKLPHSAETATTAVKKKSFLVKNALFALYTIHAQACATTATTVAIDGYYTETLSINRHNNTQHTAHVEQVQQ